MLYNVLMDCFTAYKLGKKIDKKLLGIKKAITFAAAFAMRWDISGETGKSIFYYSE
jgi:hypothetical protein